MKISKLISYGFLMSFLFLSSPIFAQTKTELQTKIDQQTKTIDSLNKVVANLDNIVENRDRSIQFLILDKEDLNKIIEEQNGKLRTKNTELVQMREQTSLGTAKKITMNNTRASWTIPPGKYWVINQFIGDYVADLATDSTGKTVGSEIFVFLQAINGTILTDPAQNQYGPLIYSSMTPYQTIQFPLVFTEGTTFSIVVYKGKIGSLMAYDGNVVCTYTEKSK